MKKRIIALILATVMSLLALASCGAASFNFAQNSVEHVSIGSLSEFLDALQKIEIEDADFTTDENIRKDKIVYDIYSSLTSAAVKKNDKLKKGELSKQDVLYFAYYCTYEEKDADGNVTATYTFMYDQMKEALITSGSTTVKAAHVVELGNLIDDDSNDYKTALYKALMEKFGENDTIVLKNDAEGDAAIDILYSTTSSTGTAVADDAVVVISYTRTFNDANGDEKKQVVLHKTLDLGKTYAEGSEEAELIKIMLGDNVTLKVGNDVTEVTKDAAGTEAKKSVFDITLDGVKYKYSEIGIEWIVNSDNGELLTFKHTPYPTTSEKVEPNGLHDKTAEKIDLKGKELTYHVYPVSYIDVPEFTNTGSGDDAYNIIKHIFGSNVKADTLEIFESEEYVNGDAKLKALVEALVKLYANDEETLKSFKNEAGEKTLFDLKKAASDAAAALKAASKDAENYADLEKADEEATKAYDDAYEYNVNAQIKKIVESKKGEELAAAKIVEQYKSDVEDTLVARYDSAIIDAVGDEVWKLIDKHFVVNSYPEEMVEEFYTHIYEQHEYDFYNGKYKSSSSSSTTSTESNYAHFKGDLEAYLVEVTKATNKDYKAAITNSAKEYLKPLLQIFALSKALEESKAANVVAKMEEYTKLDEKAGAYKVHSHEGHDHGEAEAEEEEKRMREAYENALADAKHFLVDDEALKAYKKYVGKASYDAYIDNYGEHNLRAALQANRLMYFLLCTDVEYDEDGVKSVVYKTVGEGENATKVLSFRTISYSIKAETEDDTNK